MIKNTFRPSLIMTAGLVCLGCILPAQASMVTSWTIDSANSYIKLNIPDQMIPISGTGNVTARIRTMMYYTATVSSSTKQYSTYSYETSVSSSTKQTQTLYSTWSTTLYSTWYETLYDPENNPYETVTYSTAYDTQTKSTSTAKTTTTLWNTYTTTKSTSTLTGTLWNTVYNPTSSTRASWDDDGSKAKLAGSFDTDYQVGWWGGVTGLKFLSGNNLNALNSTTNLFDPDPAAWDAVNEMYNPRGGTRAPGVMGGVALMTYSTITNTPGAFIAFRDSKFDLKSDNMLAVDGTGNFGLNITGDPNAYAGQTEYTGIKHTSVQLDGLIVASLVTVPSLNDTMDNEYGLNTKAGNIQDLGWVEGLGEHYRMTLPIYVPMGFYIDPLFLKASATGYIYADAYTPEQNIPEPMSLALLGGGVMACSRLFRRRK
jgi:hypothetical protein